ncbi:MAG: DNA polymerase I [Clostridia bacterium]|nr:DNA polymerase I [Clostridia bacterium]
MNLLVIDGNSIVNRAFFGIRLLSAKDGHYTNAIYGFMNILLSLVEKTNADGVAVAFDVKAPTFRHKMYDEYKAGRKGMPDELFEQIAPLKTLLNAYGCVIVECPGYEADDILGTISANIKESDHCYIATGDRDSLQLISPNVSVLLTTTKMGQSQTEEYDEAKLKEEYGLTPKEMIELKALQGDASDHIPGVAGIGPKTAGELIRKYHSIDAIYADLGAVDAAKGVLTKLEAGKESAFFSRKLGTICLTAPIETDPAQYLFRARDEETLVSELARHEMFKMISRLHLDAPTAAAGKGPQTAAPLTPQTADASLDVSECKEIYFTPIFDGEALLGLVLCLDGKDLYIVKDDPLAMLALFNRIFTVKDRRIIVPNTKPLFRYAIINDVKDVYFTFDVSLASYLLNPNATDYTVSAASMEAKIPLPEIPDTSAFSDVRTFLQQTAVLPVLSARLGSSLESNDQLSLLTDIEIPLAQVLAAMELTGIAVDPEGIRAYGETLDRKANELQETIFASTGETFNLNSPKQLGTVLFEKLGLPSKKKTKTGYSTNAEVLEELAADYPVVALILQYRTYAKLKSTYCDGLLKAVADDGRIHSTFNQTETRTGRLSSTEPNLQNIPVRTDVGREFRKFFVARDGYVIVDADYSQIELRVLAALAGDKNMIECFNTGVDVHIVTAANVFDVPPESVTPALRSKAKAVNFGIVYGIGAFSLAKDIHVSRAEAQSFINAYLALYADIDAYMKASIETAEKLGYAETLYHRRRYLPELRSSNRMMREFGKRVARNMPIQGTAADIIKIAMIRVYSRLQKELPDARLIMQVHDELMLEVPEGDAEKAAAILREEMENAATLQVKLDVDVGVGKTWEKAKG